MMTSETRLARTISYFRLKSIVSRSPCLNPIFLHSFKRMLRRALSISLGDPMALLQSPISATLLAVAADPVRLTLLNRLAASGTRCVCDLQLDPPIPANLLSYHLRMLREAGLVTTARRGRWVDYTLAEDALERLHAALPVAAATRAECGSCR